MDTINQSQSQFEDPREIESQEFYAGAYTRIVRSMVVIACIATLVIGVATEYRTAIGFALGCVLAGVNFYWLKRAITTFADRVTQTHTDERASRRGATRFVLRYALIAVVAYVIFKSSVVSLSAVLAGLFLPVAAILIEAAYETYVALRRGL